MHTVGAERWRAADFCRAKICAVAFDIVVLQSNLVHIHERIARASSRCGRRADEITIVAVSKTFPDDAIRAAYGLGLRHFGENRVQEWDAKRAALADLNLTVHLVGHLQSNKARRAAEIFTTIDSVDSVDLARKLDRARAGITGSDASRLPVLIEVQLAPEELKSGVSAADLPRLVDTILELPRLDLRGLMAIPPFLDDPEDVRPYFRRLRELRDETQKRIGAAAAEIFREISMGMSHDFEVAIEEGATQIRIGTALFGSRG